MKPKTWIMNRMQYKILNHFGHNVKRSLYSRFFSRLARKIVGGYIYSVKLEINELCSLHCKMCYVNNKNRELPLWMIKRILNQLKSYKIRLEILGGEPLLRNDIVEIIQYARYKSKIPFISLYTSGINITTQLANNLKRAGLDAIVVTLISHNNKIHDNFTGTSGSWDKCVKGIRICREAGINTYTFTAIHGENLKDYQKIYDFVKNELRVHALFYQYIPQHPNDPLMIDPKIWHQIKHWIMYEKNPEHSRFVRDFYLLTGSACSGGNFVLTIKADGSVQPCPFIYNLSLGSIYENSIWGIYRNRFNVKELKEFKSVPEECKSCTYQSVCAGGCKAGNDKLYGDYSRKDHRCLGPYAEKFDAEKVIDRVPSFF